MNLRHNKKTLEVYVLILILLSVVLFIMMTLYSNLVFREFFPIFQNKKMDSTETAVDKTMSDI